MAYWSAWKKPDDLQVVGMVHDDDYLSANLNRPTFNKKWLINIHRKPLEYLACRKLTKVIANSDYIRDYILKMYSCRPEKVHRLYQTINIASFPFQQPRAIDLNTAIKVLFVKSDYPRGGLKLLIDALALLPYSFQLTIMGPKQKEKKMIDAFFKGKNNIQQHFLGPSGQEIVSNALQNHDLFCVPAHKEGLGMANIEALASGIPVVSTKTGGIPEVLDHGKNGWLSPADRPESLAKTLKACLENPEERAKRSHQGRTFVEQNFNHQSMLEELIKILMD